MADEETFSRNMFTLSANLDIRMDNFRKENSTRKKTLFSQSGIFSRHFVLVGYPPLLMVDDIGFHLSLMNPAEVKDSMK